MNYEQALKEMWAFNEKTPMGANVIALYSFLLKCYSDKKQLVISDYELAKILVMARQRSLSPKTNSETGDLLTSLQSGVNLPCMNFCGIPNTKTQQAV